MKKVILSAAALIFTMGVYSQATPQSPDAPTQAQGLTNNSGDPDANMGLSIQNGNANKVQVQQAGTNQQVYTIQDDGAGTGGNLARVMQTGTVSAASGVENAAEVQQSGSENQSHTEQEGDRNEALTRQGQDNDMSSGNRAWIRQGNGGHAEDNLAGIDQDGDDNQALTIQTYDNSAAWTKQIGDLNQALVMQNSGPNQTQGHAAEIDQVGDDNKSWINQTGNAGNEAVTYQLGDGNSASQTQVNTSNAASGDENNAMIAQGDNATGNFFSPIWVDLQGIDDITPGSQNADSFNATAFQDQEGSRNIADIRQFSSAPAGGNYAEQNQTGDDNESFIIQNYYGNPNGGDNYSRQDQEGDFNQAGISQSGEGHRAYQRQYDNFNVALSTQRGFNNDVNTYQSGNNNYAATAQRGQNNEILVVQKGGHSYSVQQNLLDGMPNGGNSADILQLGPNGNFSTDGENCIFQSQNSPLSDMNIATLTIDCPDC